MPPKLCRALAVRGKREGRFPEAWYYHGGSPLAPGAFTLAKEEVKVVAVPGGNSQVSARKRDPQLPRKERNTGCAL